MSCGVASVSLDRTVSTADLLSAFDVDHIGIEALLFQTGYLTITGEKKLGGMPLYRLGYPNREVRQSLNRVLLRHLPQDTGHQMQNSLRLARLLETGDCAGLRDLFLDGEPPLIPLPTAGCYEPDVPSGHLITR